MCENVHSFLPPKHFLQDVFHSTNTLYVRLPYPTTAGKVNEFILGRFMLVLGVVLGVSRLFSVYLGGSQLFSVIRYTGPIYIPHKQHRTQTSLPHTLHIHLQHKSGCWALQCVGPATTGKNIAYTYRLGRVAYTCMIYNVMLWLCQILRLAVHEYQ